MVRLSTVSQVVKAYLTHQLILRQFQSQEVTKKTKLSAESSSHISKQNSSQIQRSSCSMKGKKQRKKSGVRLSN